MATILKGDCLKIMASLPDKSVDCFICDLPYGQLHPERKSEGHWYDMPQSKGCQWDVKIDLVEFWKQVKRLAKDDHTPVLMFCNTKFGYDLIKSNEKWFRYDLVVDKAKTRGVSFLSANRMPLKSHEMVYVFSKKGAYYKRIDLPPDERCPVSVIKINNFASKDKHPTEKPEELYEWLLSRYCPAGGTVLDPTAGSFNSISVARNLGFKAIGIEKNTSFFWKGVASLI